MHSKCRKCKVGAHPTKSCLQQQFTELPIYGHVNIKDNHPLFKLNKICAISGNTDHKCCSLVHNQSINKVNLSEPNYYTNTENWINSDGKSINYSQNPSPQLITQFNKCSLLPLIQAQVNNHTVCAIVDSGATRSLVSSDMATKLCGENNQQKTKPFRVPLLDVNQVNFNCVKTHLICG